MSDKAVHFLKQAVNNPQTIGAIAPSSDELAEAAVESIDWTDVRVVAEYGPGTGAITAAIVDRLDGRDFFAIELNETYAQGLLERFPGLTVYHDSVENLQAILERHGVAHIDAVVSSLPWVLFSDELQERLLDETMRALSPNGQFSTFTYLHGLVTPRAKAFRERLESLFSEVKRSDVVWRNVPPAVVYSCRR